MIKRATPFKYLAMFAYLPYLSFFNMFVTRPVDIPDKTTKKLAPMPYIAMSITP